MPTTTSRSTRLGPSAGAVLVHGIWLLVCWGLMAGRVQAQAPRGAPGWVFTPGVTVGQVWDNNVTLSTEGGQAIGESASDFLTVITPRVALGYRGRSTIQPELHPVPTSLSGAEQLNAYDQRLATSFVSRSPADSTSCPRNSLSRVALDRRDRRSRRRVPSTGRDDRRLSRRPRVPSRVRHTRSAVCIRSSG